jgi:hypothetical protein
MSAPIWEGNADIPRSPAVCVAYSDVRATGM